MRCVFDKTPIYMNEEHHHFDFLVIIEDLALSIRSTESVETGQYHKPDLGLDHRQFFCQASAA